MFQCRYKNSDKFHLLQSTFHLLHPSPVGHFVNTPDFSYNKNVGSANKHSSGFPGMFSMS